MVAFPLVTAFGEGQATWSMLTHQRAPWFTQQCRLQRRRALLAEGEKERNGKPTLSGWQFGSPALSAINRMWAEPGMVRCFAQSNMEVWLMDRRTLLARRVFLTI